jgi:HTH-type transcriptional regulator/antitoxin HigA
VSAQNIKKENLVEIFGSSEIFDKIMSGDLEITSVQAVALGNLFHVDSSLFLND